MTNNPRFKHLAQLCLALLSLLLCSQLHSSTINIDQNFVHQTIGLGVEYIEEGGDPLPLSEVMNREQWTVSEHAVLNFGFTDSAYWIRFRIENSTNNDKQLILDFSYPYLDLVNVNLLFENGDVQKFALGDSLPATARTIFHSHNLVPIDLPRQQSVHVYIHAKSTATLQIPMDLWERDRFVEKDHAVSILYGLLYGLLLAIALYHILIFFSIKEYAFLNYALLNISILLAYACQHGIPPVFFWPNIIGATDYLLLVAFGGSTFFSAMFVYQVLRLNEFRRKMGYGLKAIAALAVILTALSFIAPYGTLIKLQILLSIISIFVVGSALLIRTWDGFPPAKYALIAAFSAGVGHIVVMLEKAGTVESTFITANASYLGTLVMIMLYSFALSYRMNMDRTARDVAQQELIQTQKDINENLDRIVRDRTDALEKANQKLQEISNTDGLTGLRNRRYFDESFTAELKRAYREKADLGLLLMDLDHFKKINDTYGHPFGDLCLQKAASNILSCIRRPGDLAARYGGEEFVVLLPQTDQAGTEHIAQQILKAFNEVPVADEDHSVLVTASIGAISVIPSTGSSAEQLLKKADELLYLAKQNGRNRLESYR